MKSLNRLASVAVGAALAASPVLMSSTADAATGGTRVATNPGIVALTDAAGHQVCSGVLVAPQWVLTFEGPMTCGGAQYVTGNSHDHVGIEGQKFARPASGIWGNDPTESQAMLVKLAGPIKSVKPAQLSNVAPRAGEKLTAVAFNGPEGINHVLSVGRTDVKATGHNAWISWYAQSKQMRLGEGDSGALIMRGDKVVAFTGLVTAKTFDAEDVANVYDWVRTTTGAR